MRGRITQHAAARLGSRQLWDTQLPGFGVRRRGPYAHYELQRLVNGKRRQVAIGVRGAP